MIKDIGDFFTSARDFHVCVAGDVMLDRYLWGSIDRISPEAPVPVLLLASIESRLGGAANVALNVRRLGARASVAGVTGDDDAGRLLSDICASEAIDTSLLFRDAAARTTIKTRVLGGHQHLLRVDDEAQYHPQAEFLTRISKAIDTAWDADAPDVLILQDYNKGFLSAEMIAMLLNQAASRRIPVVVDPKAENFFAFRGVAIFKPNLRELQAKVPFPVDISEATLSEACAWLTGEIGCRRCAITLSDQGIYISDGVHGRLYPTRPRQVKDVCGAGDAVVAVLALAHLAGMTDEQAALLANAAGGVVCETVGVCPVDATAMREELVIR